MLIWKLKGGCNDRANYSSRIRKKASSWNCNRYRSFLKQQLARLDRQETARGKERISLKRELTSRIKFLDTRRYQFEMLKSSWFQRLKRTSKKKLSSILCPSISAVNISKSKEIRGRRKRKMEIGGNGETAEDRILHRTFRISERSPSCQGCQLEKVRD